MKVIGITGGKGTGKSTVLQYIKDQGYHTIDLFDALKEILSEEEVQRRLKIPKGNKGNGISQENLSKLELDLNSTEDNRTKTIVIPRIKKYLKKKIFLNSLLGRSTLFVEVSFLYECKLEDLFGTVIVVTCGPKSQEERLLESDNHSSNALEIIKIQGPLAEKRRRCNSVIDNNRSLEDTFQQVDILLSNCSCVSIFYLLAIFILVLSIVLPFILSKEIILSLQEYFKCYSLLLKTFLLGQLRRIQSLYGRVKSNFIH
ncbi:dephospho-CoA kinase [Nematocida sp. AWRm80]|nr:dephospho-CoA kinase [Nematocida sp. AWRm80]